MKDENCLFCKIVSGKINTSLVYEDEQVVAFRDINPQSPTHILIIPRKHMESILACKERDQKLMGHLLCVARKIAGTENLEEKGFRIILNTGSEGGQTVPHLHFHLMGGRPFHWPPG